MISNRQEKGITLIALVVSIVVLLILATVSIQMLGGENGIIKRAIETKDKTKEEGAKEQIAVEVAGSYGIDGKIDIPLLNENLGHIDGIKGLPITSLPATVELDGVKVVINGNGSTEPILSIEKATSYVGYYADLNKDGQITLADDGIIYADLAIGGSGTWNNDEWSSYSYDAVTSGLNEYIIISETSEVDPLKTGNGIIQLSQENATDRFYIMALEDINPGTYYCWYDAAYGKLDKTVATDYNDFGQGRANSEYVMAKWDDASLPWGAHNDNGTYLDLWGVIKDKYEEGWFVPSKAEWSAFGDYLYTNCGLTTSNYSTYGLSEWYWSSSQGKAYDAYAACFSYGCSDILNVNYNICVRLSATF